MPANDQPVLIHPSSQSSNDTHVLVPTPPVSSGSIGPYGMNPPSSSAPAHDLSINFYNYQVRTVGAQIYTDKLLYGKSSIDVLVTDYEKLSGAAPKSIWRFTLYKADGSFVDKAILGTGYVSSHKFTGLSPTTKYFVGWNVAIGGENKYAFNGKIS